MRSSPRPRSPAATVAAVLVILVCLGVVTWSYWPIKGILLPAYAVIGLILGFRYCPPFAVWFVRMPVAHRLVFCGLLAAVILGHFRQDKRYYFPFVAWDIFATVTEKDPVTCREMIGTTMEGKAVRLLVEQLFPSVVQFEMPPPDQPEKLDRLVRALARTYNEQHAADPVRHVDLMLVAVQLHPRADEWQRQPSCEFLQRYDISPDR